MEENKIRDIYIRVSRTMGREGDSYQTEEIQEEACQRYLKQRKLEPGLKVFEEDVSGGKKVKDRRLEELVQRVEKGESGGIVSFNVKRFARSLSQGAEAIKRIKDTGGEYSDSYGNSTNGNSLAINIYLSIGEDELEKLTEQWLNVRERVLRSGHWGSGKPPLGYIHPHKRSSLVIDPKLAPVIVELFELRLEGYTIRRLWEHLNERLAELGYPPYKAAKGVHKILTNRVYLGEIHINGFEPNLKAHDAIVSHTLFNRANKMVKPRGGRNGKSERLLARLGVLVCGNCGARMSVSHAKGGGNRPDSAPWLPMYNCREFKCTHSVSIQAEIAEQAVWQWVVEHNATGGGDVADKARKAAKAFAEAQDEYDAFMDSETGSFNPRRAADVKRKAKMEAKLDELEATAAKLGEGTTVGRIPANSVLEFDEKRQLIKVTVQRAIVRDVSTHGTGAQRIKVIGFN